MSRHGSLDIEWPSYELFVMEEALVIYQERVFTSYLRALWLSSALGNFIHMYFGTGSLGRRTPAYEGGKAPPLLPHSQYICCNYIIEDRQSPQSL